MEEQDYRYQLEQQRLEREIDILHQQDYLQNNQVQYGEEDEEELQFISSEEDDLEENGQQDDYLETDPSNMEASGQMNIDTMKNQFDDILAKFLDKEKTIKGMATDDLTGRINEELALTKDSMNDPNLYQYTQSNQKTSYN